MSDFVVNNTAPITMSVDQTTRIIEAISPTLTLTRTAYGLKITVRDKSGTNEAMIYDGTDGTDGQTGPQGDPGPMPVLSVGNVVTGEPGSSVTVTLTGTDANPVLNMSIPKGDKGDTGNTGATGVGISNVVVNADYTLTVTMTNGTSYTSGSIRGEKGETGDTGETGATPQFSIGLVETLDPDDDAYVELDESSTEEFPILNFGIPQGIDGDATVDDTAGSGDTTHVWSADKSVKAIAESAATKADIIGVEEAVQEAVKTLTDGAAGAKMAVTVGIEPVQNLNGQANPWPAGGTAQIWDEQWELGSLNTDGTTKAADNIIRSKNFIPADGSKTYYVYGNILIFQYDTNDTVLTYAWVNNTTFTTESGCAKLKFRTGSGTTTYGHDISINYPSTDTSYHPYSNICPISGWSAVKVSRTGENLADSSEFTNRSVNSGGSFSDNPARVMTGYMPVTVGKDYVVKCEPGKSPTVMRFFNSSKSAIGSNITVTDSAITAPTNAAYAVVCFKKDDGSNISTTELEKAFVGLDDEEETYTISIPSTPGTVYGGTLTIHRDGTGKLVVDRATESIEGTETFIGTATSVGGLYASDDKFNKFKTSTTGVDLCDTYPAVTAANTSSMEDKTIARQSTSSNRLFIKDSQFANMTSTQLETYFTSHPVQYCGKLITPVEYELTAEQVNAIITSLKGTNNVFADTGDVLVVDYDADTKLYVDVQISEKVSASQRLMELIVTANREDSMTATKAYSSGDLLIVNNTLYRATTSIANGATLTDGTNVTATTVAAEIAAL